MADVRPPAVAGLFYPADPPALRSLVRRLLAAARTRGGQSGPPEALIVPHAGYAYSGPIAASAFSRLEPYLAAIRRVVLVGPAHHVAFRGLAASTADAFASPLGDLPLAPLPEDAAARLGIVANDRAHAPEHSLEVQLPFLREVLGEVAILPLLTGSAAPDDVARALRALRTPGTLIVVSSDLSHYLPYEEARRRDAATAAAIVALDPARVRGDDACGHTAVQGLLLAARTWRLHATAADLRNSGDTAGGRGEVVGYGAFVFTAADQTGGISAHHHEEEA